MVQERIERAPKVLTTGQIARICSVAPRTVSKWFDLGQLRGYRIPGSRDRRVPLDQLVRFMKAHNMPLNGLDAGPRRVLLIHPDLEMSQTIVQRLNQAGFQALSAQTVFEAGLLAERIRPHIIILDDAHADRMSEIAAVIRREPQLSDVRLVALEEPNGQPPAEPRRGFDVSMVKPFSVTQLVGTLNDLLE